VGIHGSFSIFLNQGSRIGSGTTGRLFNIEIIMNIDVHAYGVNP
jgi:hypothetical protein